MNHIAEGIDWGAMRFAYTRTNTNLRCYYYGGHWGDIEPHNDEYISLHIAATAFHYGQAAFEGLKAFRGRDGHIRIFRMEENARRMQASAERLRMAVPPVELFCDMVRRVVELNAEFTPPYESGGSLYIRPVLFGSGPKLGVSPADEYVLVMFASPVGPYYPGGIKGIRTMVDYHFDRAAPRGTGMIKSAGNYGASLMSSEVAHQRGYDGVIYTDPREQKYVDECGTANFFGIRHHGKKATYVTPASDSILPSVTNMSLRTLARDMGMKVEERHVKIRELSKFDEAGACGTAAVITPIAEVYDARRRKTILYKEGMGPWSQKLYNQLTAIQRGDAEDTHHWVRVL